MIGEDSLVLGEMMCARLCHDLAGAIGAVGTGVELLNDEDSPAEDKALALAMLVDSSQAAIGRLKFLRVALGSAGGALPLGHLRDLAERFLAGGGVTLRWQVAATPKGWSDVCGKLLLNLVMMARDSLPRGGDIEVLALENGAEGLLVTARGQGVHPSASAAVLAGQGAVEPGPKAVQGYYVSALAARAGWMLNCRDRTDSMHFEMVKT